MLMSKFQKFTRHGQFGKSSRRDMRKSESSSEDYKKKTCHKCKKSGHYIADCPCWVRESKKKKYKDESSDDSKKKKKSSKSSSSKSSSHNKTSFRKARALIGKEIDSEAEYEECDEEEGSKVPNDASSSDSSDCEPDDFKKPSYSKLAIIATKQQTALEKPRKLLGRSDDLLNDEMNITQILTEDMKIHQSRYDNLQDRHGTLLADHEKLHLEKLRISHDDLRMENDSLLAQLISAALVEFIPPFLKCIECETANSSPESSNASIATNCSTAHVVSNSSLEETTNVRDDNAGLKELYVIGMYKIPKGHQTLCDVLTKKILNRNPRKGGIAFERKLNVDGSY
ncbi:hypothetical protein ZWY2020_048189 [Hordeum vulgare]|nr:hypothetical protein ZWY2020_048189 [Hordeum vulgare]